MAVRLIYIMRTVKKTGSMIAMLTIKYFVASLLKPSVCTVYNHIYIFAAMDSLSLLTP